MAAAATVRQGMAGTAAFSMPQTAPAPWPRDFRLDADTQLVERCLRGDDAAWEDLVRVHTRKVYAICLRFTGSDHEAQDLTQEVFLRIFRTLKTFRAGEGSFGVWLARLTRNLLIDHYRRSRVERASESLEGARCSTCSRAPVHYSSDPSYAARQAPIDAAGDSGLLVRTGPHGRIWNRARLLVQARGSSCSDRWIRRPSAGSPRP